jgi:protein-S-isoprenylcysteine O-methyltransferase Ste14
MEEFRISEESVRKVRRKTLTHVVPVVVLVLALAFMSAYFNRTHPIKTSEISGGLIIVLLVGSVVYSGTERAEEPLGSYVITIDKHSIRRRAGR